MKKEVTQVCENVLSDASNRDWFGAELSVCYLATNPYWNVIFKTELWVHPWRTKATTDSKLTDDNFDD